MHLNLSKLAVFILLLISLGACRLQKINRFKNQQQHGYWITYADSAHKLILTEGRFKEGIQVGKWIYNDFKGHKERIEIYRGKKMRIKHFHTNGQLALKGKAKITIDEKKLHFYYYGPWYFYTDKGQLQKISYYENGNLIKEEYKSKSLNTVYDTLNAELTQLDKDFVKYRDTLAKTNKLLGPKSEEYKSLLKMSKQNDSLIYLRIQKITTRFGYPEKKYTGENNAVIFYIIGFAPVSEREKYLDLFKSAAVKGDIGLRDYAYFEDKYNVAKYGWQYYGTQYKTEKDYKQIYFPVKKLADLNDRRKLMNLEPVNLLDYKEVKD